MLRLLLVLYGFALPYESIWSGTGGSETIFKPYRIIGLAVLALWTVALLRRARLPRLDLHDKIFLTLFALGLSLAAFWRVLAGQGSLLYAANATALGLFAWSIALVVKNEARDSNDVERFWIGFVLGNVTALLASFAVGEPYDSGRLVGFYHNPNSLAFSLAASGLYLVARLLRRPRSLASLFALACLVGFSVAILLTSSRAGILAYAGSLLVSFFLAPRRPGRLKLQLPLAAVIAALVAYAAYETWQSEHGDNMALQRLEWEEARYGSGRLDVWRAGWNVAQDYYFIGVGTSQYRYYHEAYIDELDKLYSPTVARHALGVHSEYLNLLISCGFFGLGLYLVLIIHTAKVSRRAVASAAGSLPCVHAALPLLLLLAIVQITAILFGSPLFFFLLALVALAGRLRPASDRRAEAPGGLRPAVRVRRRRPVFGRLP